MSEHIGIRRTDGVLDIRIQRAEKKNALTRDMYRALAQALEDASGDKDVRAVLIRGTEGCFSSGNDLNDFLERSPGIEERPAARFLRALARLPQPLVAAVSGVAVGIGTTLLLHCDLVFAAPDARFQLPFVKLGLVPEAASTLLLPQMAGYHQAAELLLLGETFDAATAAQAGIVNAVVDTAQLDAHAEAVVGQLTRLPPLALASTKRLMKQHELKTVLAVMDSELDEFLARLQSAEAHEAINAVLDKREPNFTRGAGSNPDRE